MKKLVIEINCDECLEDGDIANILKHAPSSSLFLEFGKPHENPELAEEGIAQVFALDIAQYSVKIEDDEK